MSQNILDPNFLTQYSLEKRFAILLSDTRNQQGVTLEQLSEGLCTESQLAKIEKAERLPARTLQKRLLEQILQGKKDVRELGKHTAITIDDAFAMYEEMLAYVQHGCYGTLAKAQIYPKIVFYMYRQLMPYIEKQRKEQQHRLLQRLLVVVNRGIRFLQQQEVGYYLFELLESKVYLMQQLSEYLLGRNVNEKRSRWNALQRQTAEWKETLQNVYTEYGISYITKDCCYLYHEKKIYSLGQTIAKRRKLLGFTQEALCDGICAKKTLMRLEKGKGKAQTAIVMQLLERLHLIGEYLHRLIITDKRELLDTFDQFKYEVNMGEYDLAEKLLGELREKLEKNAFNEQALAMDEHILLFYTKKMSSAEYVQKMKEVLQYTVPLESASKEKDELYLTDSEEMLLYHIAIGYKWAENYDKAYEVLHELEKVYAKYAEEKLVDSHIAMYEFIMVVVANLYLCRKEYEKAEELLQQLLVQALKAKRLHTIHKVLVLLVYKEIQENILPKERMQSKLEAGICISQICKEKLAEREYGEY